jgi:hypothetical protein
MKDNPLIIGEGLSCVIANPFKWIDLFEQDEPPQLKEIGIRVQGCTITFPDEETKTLFCLRFL